jgi:hypothetical protein
VSQQKPAERPDPAFIRSLERAAFAINEAERLGVRFVFGLEAIYPANLPANCVQTLERAIGVDRVLISCILVERAGVAP